MLFGSKTKEQKLEQFIEGAQAVQEALNHVFPINVRWNFGDGHNAVNIPNTARVAVVLPEVLVSYVYKENKYDPEEVKGNDWSSEQHEREAQDSIDGLERYRTQQARMLRSLELKKLALFDMRRMASVDPAKTLEQNIADALKEVEQVEGAEYSGVRYTFGNLGRVVGQIEQVKTLIPHLIGLGLPEERAKPLQEAVKNATKYGKSLRNLPIDYTLKLAPEVGAKLIASGLAKPLYQNAPTQP